MKKSQRDHISSMDDFEDLTLFANESFDTEDVDLFEFTSEESSPLTRLKSIILSLDWEINDETLQELEDELGNLKAMWQGDKVADVYLQGLNKIGNYIRTKGAYAHPNSIKLLLTFFYNFEKIISSTQITGEEITQILKIDVRKFKILQYQINQSEMAEAAISDTAANPDATSISTGMSEAMTAQEACKQLKAAILSLDWEVTNESLRQFNERIDAFQAQVTDNKPALVLIQGLQALGDYIADERADSHPESFALLDSFSDALEEFVKADGEQLSQDKVQDILVDRINRLNNLKILIASPQGGEVDAQKLDQVFEELDTASTDMVQTPPASIISESGPVLSETIPSLELTDTSTEDLAAELDTLFVPEAMPAMESAEVQYPDEVLPPDAIHPVDDELADDFIESHLSSKRGLTPALSDVDEATGFDAGAEPLDLPAQNDFTDQLDLLFANPDDKEEPAISLPAFDSEELALALEDEERPVAALTEENQEPEHDLVVAALSDAEVPADDDEPDRALGNGIKETDFNSLDIQSTLDSFFADADKEQDEALAASSELEADSDLIAAFGGATDLADQKESEQSLSTAEGEADFGSLEIESELDSFFTNITDTDKEQGEALTASSELEADSDLIAAFGDAADLGDQKESEQGSRPAEEEADFGSLEIESELDSFFTNITDTDKKQGEALAASSELEADSDLIAAFGDAADLDDQEENGQNLSTTVTDPDLKTLEIQSKLDNFFTETSEEQSKPAEVSTAEVEKIEHTLFFNEADNLQSALADSSDERGFSEEEEIAALNFTPMDEIEEKLDLFFGADEEELEEDTLLAGSLEESLGFDMPDNESASVPDALAGLDAHHPISRAETVVPEIEAGEEPTSVPFELDELTMALEASIDDGPQPAMMGTAESTKIQLAALGALLPLVVRTPSRDNLAEAAAMVQTFKQADLSPLQHSLVQLLESTLTLLVRLPTKDHAATEKLVNYLYGQLTAEKPQANVLAEAIGRFTAWMHEAGKIMPVVPAAAEQQQEPEYTYTAKELYFELSELRSYMREEFAKLQHDMQHHK